MQTETSTTTPPDQPELLTVTEVGAIVRLSRVTIWRWARAGDFPRPIHVGPRVYWVGAEVRGWLADRMAERVAA